jgi:hypothetical protein
LVVGRSLFAFRCRGHWSGTVFESINGTSDAEQNDPAKAREAA